MTTPTKQAALDALYSLEGFIKDGCDARAEDKGHSLDIAQTILTFILAQPDAAPEKVEGLEEAVECLFEHEHDAFKKKYGRYPTDVTNEAARLYSQGHVAAPSDKAIRAGRAVYDFTFNDGDTLGTLIHQSEYINGNQPLDAQLRDVRLICQQIAEAALSPKADVSAPSDKDSGIDTDGNKE